MRVAVVVARMMSGVGGMENMIVDLVRSLNEAGDEAILITSAQVGTSGWYKQVPHCKLSYKARIFSYPFLIVSLWHALAKFKPDVIIAADPKAVQYSKWYTKWYKSKAPVGAWSHSPLLRNKKGYRLGYADFFLAISSGIAEEFKQYRRSDSNNIYLAYNFTKSTTQRIKRSKTPIFVHMGKLSVGSPKCTDDLLRALALLQGEWKAIFVGSANPQLRELSKSLGIDEKIEWTGWLDKPWEAVNEASLFVLTSDMEGFGLVLAEALNRGLPCLSSDCISGPSDIIKSGINGWLYPVGKQDLLVERLQAVINDLSCLPSAEACCSTGAMFTEEVVIPEIRRILAHEVRGKL